MTTIKKIHKAVEVASPVNNSPQDFENYQRQHSYLDEYLSSDVKKWTYETIDDFSGSERIYSFDIWRVLEAVSRDFFTEICKFKKEAIVSNFYNAINCMYQKSFPAIGYLIKKDKGLGRFAGKKKVVHYFLCSLCFFPIDEQELLFKTLHLHDDDFFASKPLPQSLETIIPLAYHLADEYFTNPELKEIINEGKKEFKFNQTYQKFYDAYLEKDENIANQIFVELCEYHLKNSCRSRKVFTEIEFLESQPIPYEILILLKHRKEKGLNIDFINHPLISDIIPIISKDGFVLSEKNKLIRSKVFKDLEINPTDV